MHLTHLFENQMNIQSTDSKVTSQTKASVANSHAYRTNIQHYPTLSKSTVDKSGGSRERHSDVISRAKLLVVPFDRQTMTS